MFSLYSRKGLTRPSKPGPLLPRENNKCGPTTLTAFPLTVPPTHRHGEGWVGEVEGK